jgi:hypothetical protein
MNETPASLSLKASSIPVNGLTTGTWEEGRKERARGGGNRSRNLEALRNGIRFRSWGLAARAAGWLAEDESLTHPYVAPKLFPCPEESAIHVARKIAARYEEWI